MVRSTLTPSVRPDDDEGLIGRLGTLRQSDDPLQDSIQFAVRCLKEARSSAVRNAAALALSDLGAMTQAATIADVAGRPDVAPCAGTLLYAIEELGADLPLSTFVAILVDGSYEARQQALDLLVSGHVVDDDPTQFGHRCEQLEALLNLGDAEKGAAAIEALAMLKSEADPDHVAVPSR